MSKKAEAQLVDYRERVAMVKTVVADDVSYSGSWVALLDYIVLEHRLTAGNQRRRWAGGASTMTSDWR